MKNLPIGLQSFEKLRQKDCLYVDKTEVILRLITSGSVYFLSRPRRFGKSLLVSTMDALFQGKKSLFKGLYIYDKWDWTQTNPVIRLDFAGKAHQTTEELKNSLSDFIRLTASDFGVSVESTELPDRFGELIKKLHDSTGRQVVVLIDEYDKPIIEHLTDLPVAEENRNLLRSFYGILKSADEHLRFVFLTGVSKFAKVSIFSELNNLTDITMNSEFAVICGYTQMELEAGFMGYDINRIGLVQILFQTGYLTVKTKQFIPMKPAKYTLAIPNEEVNDSFLAFLVSSYTGYPIEQMPC